MGNKPLSDSNRALRSRLYILISLMLAVPVLSWPLAFGRMHLQVVDWVQPVDLWRFALVCMLLVVVMADTMLAGVSKRVSMMMAAVWIVGSYMAAFLSLQLPVTMGVYMLACVLVMHAGRSAWRLWSGRRDWWLWPAWTRDTVVSFGVFAWFV